MDSPDAAIRAELLARLKALAARMRDLSPVMNQLGEIAVASVATNFAEGGRYGIENEFGGGSQKWDVSERAEEDGGLTFVNTGVLANSTDYWIEGNTLVIGSNEPQAAILHFGGDAGRNDSVHFDPNPIYTLQNIDLADMIEVIEGYLSSLVATA